MHLHLRQQMGDPREDTHREIEKNGHMLKRVDYLSTVIRFHYIQNVSTTTLNVIRSHLYDLKFNRHPQVAMPLSLGAFTLV